VCEYEAVYVPRRYEVSESDAWGVVESVGAGFLVVATVSGLRSVFAPVVAAPAKSKLFAHVSRGNPWWSDAHDGDAFLGLFRVADAYVSPSLYPGKQTDPRVAPTWNYDVVEIQGRVTIHDDPTVAERVVRDLTDQHESQRPERWSVDDAPPEFVSALLKGIVALEIDVVSIIGAAKLSQNQSDLDRLAVRDTFSRGDDRQRAVARRMGSTS